MNKLPPFHLAFPVSDLAATEAFYCQVLGCKMGRRSDTWIDFDFYGHQIVAHLSEMTMPYQPNEVDSKSIPVPHFGVILEWSKWEQLVKRFRNINIEFIVEPYIRFAGQAGEQATMFFRDPAGNAIEIKAFRDFKDIFATDLDIEKTE